MSGVTTITAAGIPIVGRSVAGQESWYRLPTLRAALEIGRCPNALVPVASVFVTHAHLDHAAGVASYASQRTLHGLGVGRVFIPVEARGAFARILDLHAELEGVERYAAELVGMSAGERVSLRHDLYVEAFAGSHRVPCTGYLFAERRHKLKPEFAGLPGPELARIREDGVDVAALQENALLAYPGDCDASIFDRAPQILRARVLLLECTFLRPGEEERAARYGHLHLSDLVRRAGEFENEAIVLTHFSAKYTKEEILSRLADGIPPVLRDRVTAFV